MSHKNLKVIPTIVDGKSCKSLSKKYLFHLRIYPLITGTLKRFESQKLDNPTIAVTGKVLLKSLWEKIPFFILSAVFSIITLYAQLKPSVKHYQFPLSSRLANAPVSFMTYLEKTFVPNHMAVFYPFSFQLPAWQVWGSVFLILFISIVVIISMKRLPYLFTGWFWYAITLLPVIGIIPVGGFSMADRYTYLPSNRHYCYAGMGHSVFDQE